MDEENGPSLSIGRGSGNTNITVTPVIDEYGYVNEFAVRVDADGLGAHLTLDYYEFDGLSPFLSELAEEFRGWPEARTWESHDGNLTLAATHDRRGHVAITWTWTRARSRNGEPWSTAVTTSLEAGEELRRLAADTAAFLGDTFDSPQ